MTQNQIVPQAPQQRTEPVVGQEFINWMNEQTSQNELAARRQELIIQNQRRILASQNQQTAIARQTAYYAQQSAYYAQQSAVDTKAFLTLAAVIGLGLLLAP
jgi:hypothetical protein